MSLSGTLSSVFLLGALNYLCLRYFAIDAPHWTDFTERKKSARPEQETGSGASAARQLDSFLFAFAFIHKMITSIAEHVIDYSASSQDGNAVALRRNVLHSLIEHVF